MLRRLREALRRGDPPALQPILVTNSTTAPGRGDGYAYRFAPALANAPMPPDGFPLVVINGAL